MLSSLDIHKIKPDKVSTEILKLNLCIKKKIDILFNEVLLTLNPKLKKFDSELISNLIELFHLIEQEYSKDLVDRNRI